MTRIFQLIYSICDDSVISVFQNIIHTHSFSIVKLRENSPCVLFHFSILLHEMKVVDVDVKYKASGEDDTVYSVVCQELFCLQHDLAAI